MEAILSILPILPCPSGPRSSGSWTTMRDGGVSLPRSTLYCHYLLHCQEQKLEPVNASFGKLIRSVFMGLHPPGWAWVGPPAP